MAVQSRAIRREEAAGLGDPGAEAAGLGTATSVQSLLDFSGLGVIFQDFLYFG